MIKVIRSLIILILLFLLGLAYNAILAQSVQSFEDQTKLIRIKKIATEWQGSNLTLHTREGEVIHGRLVEVVGGSYHMEQQSRQIKVPLQNVIKVSFEPGLPELFLSFASAVMGGGFLSGALLIAKDDASQADVSIAALLGLIAGGWWGYSTFYESEVIYLE